MVVSVDGKPVLTIEQLSRTIDGYNVGDTVHLSVVRGGRTLDLSAALQEWTGR